MNTISVKFFSILLVGIITTSTLRAAAEDQAYQNSCNIPQEAIQFDPVVMQQKIDVLKPKLPSYLDGARSTAGGLLQMAFGSYLLLLVSQADQSNFYTVAFGTTGGLLLANGVYDSTTGIMKIVKTARR
jgi:hypothetical protein